MDIKLIAFDLDGTLLDDRKRIAPRTMRALEAAAEQGVILVPATGRIRTALPKIVAELPFVHYLITINGGMVWDTDREQVVYRKIFDREQSLEIWDYINRYDSMNDIYADGVGWMEPKNPEMFPEYVKIPEMIELIRSSRKIIPNVRNYIENCEGVEKFNMYFADMELQAKAKKEVAERFPYMKATTSVINNIELNHKDAIKGNGLSALCTYLNIPIENVMAFGDGDNDTTMLQAAGVGVAMGNAVDSLKAVADLIAPTNEECGVADIIERYVLKQA